VFYTPGGLVDRTLLHDAAGASIAETTHSYDGLGRKVRQQTVHAVSRQTTADFEWIYDSLDLVTTIKVNHLAVQAVLQYNERRELIDEAWTGNNGGQGVPPDGTQISGSAGTHQQSDPSNEAQASPHTALGVAGITKSYTYDPAGNRKTSTIGGVLTTYSYNIASQLTDEISSVQTVHHVYTDGWGNENSRMTGPPSGGSGPTVTETYVYNYLNLLSSYTKGSTASEQYDFWPTGERYAKRNLIATSDMELYVPRFGDVVTEYSDPNTLKNSYVQGTGVDSKCTRIPSSGGRKHYLGDSVGTVSVTLTDAGTTSETSLKDVWGVQISLSVPTSSERFGYAQREQDAESGLVHMRARQYDSRIGRFTQTDPVSGIRPSQQYIYAGNMPTIAKDPNGDFLWFVALVAAAAVFFTAQNLDSPSGPTWDPKEVKSAFVTIATAPVGGGLAGKATKFVVGGGLRSLGLTRLADPLARIAASTASGATAGEVGLFADRAIVEERLPTNDEMLWTAVAGGGLGGLGEAGAEAWQAWRAAPKAPKLTIKPPTSGETEATKLGRKMHKEYDWGPGWEQEVELPSGARPDAVNFETFEVGELKPNNPRKVREGRKQVEDYRKELEETTWHPWTSRFETYEKPK
jgi:RHS repeat-associated protein